MTTQAMPTEGDQEAMAQLLNGLSSIFAWGLHPETGDYLSGPETWVHWIGDFYDKHGRRLERTYWAGRTAIENACVPGSDVLTFKPIYAAADEMLAACKQALDDDDGARGNGYGGLSDETRDALRAAIAKASPSSP